MTAMWQLCAGGFNCHHEPASCIVGLCALCSDPGPLSLETLGLSTVSNGPLGWLFGDPGSILNEHHVLPPSVPHVWFLDCLEFVQLPGMWGEHVLGLRRKG